MKTYDGALAGMERNLLKASWDITGQRIAAGSGDRTVTIWETRTGKLLHKLPGHRGAVNGKRYIDRGSPCSKLTLTLDVRFHPAGDPVGKNGPFSTSCTSELICS